MQIYPTSPSPFIAANDLDDDRIGRAILSGARLLSGAVYTRDKFIHKNSGLHKPCELTSPLSIWTRKRSCHYAWMALYSYELCDIFRRSTNRVHVAEKVIATAAKLHYLFEKGEMEPFPDYKPYADMKCDVFTKYQRLLIRKWSEDKHTPQFRNRDIPPFWKNWE